MIATAVKVFVIEPTRYWVSGVASTPPSTSATPTADSQITAPSRRTAAATLGARFSRCAAASSCSSFAVSRSGVDTQHLPHPFDGLLDLVVADVEMRDGAQPAGAQVAHRDAAFQQPFGQAGLARDRDEVRLHSPGIDPDPLRYPLRAYVVVGQPLDVVVKRIEHRCSRDTGLPQRAAEQELRLPGPLDRLFRPCKDCPERATEALRETDRDGVGEPSPRRRLETRGDGGVEKARPVEGEGRAARARGVGD